VDEIVPSHVKFARFHFSRTHDDAAPKGREMKSATAKGEDGQHGARGNAILCREGFTDPPGLAIVGWRLNGCGKQTKGRSLRGWREVSDHCTVDDREVAQLASAVAGIGRRGG
jgi:hypothetical protein